MKLITNNPKFINNNFRGIEIEYEILTHPLYGSVKPNETIYRSIIVKKSEGLDIASINLISEAVATFEKFRNNKKVPHLV